MSFMWRAVWSLWNVDLRLTVNASAGRCALLLCFLADVCPILDVSFFKQYCLAAMCIWVGGLYMRVRTFYVFCSM